MFNIHFAKVILVTIGTCITYKRNPMVAKVTSAFKM